jgi:RNA polymerase sigma-70 factor (ECF subfamily)
MNMRNDGVALGSWPELRPRLELYLASFSALGAEDREDALQATMIAYATRGAQRDGDHRAWAYRVARNAAIDAIRRRNRERRLVERSALGLPVTLEPESPYRGPEDRAMDAEDEAFVARFIAGLKDAERELLHLAYAEAMTYAEIAAATGAPLGTVKWRLASVKRRLKAAYEREYL